MEVGGGQDAVAACTGAAAVEMALTEGTTRARTLDLACLASETWLILKPSYLFDLVLLLTTVVSSGILALREAHGIN